MIGFFINLFKSQPSPSRVEQLQMLKSPPSKPLEVPVHLDVRKILLRVSPGAGGMGQEEYATCVADVEALLTSMGQKLEGYQQGRMQYKQMLLVAKAVKEAADHAQFHRTILTDKELRSIINNLIGAAK